MKLQIKKMTLYFILFLMVLWMVNQLIQVMFPGEATQDAEKMLYQVSLFQLELLNNALHEASISAWSTEQLNTLKQAAYAANYTHERYRQAIGPSKLTSLESLKELIQFVLRLQIGGYRELKELDREAIREVSEAYRELYESYAHLLSRNGSMNSSQNNELSRIDHETYEYLQKVMLD